jgi:phosphoglycolate phosphatase-like HAD superfamily hydrolase
MASPDAMRSAAAPSVDSLLSGAAIVFWDFDGVVKDSVSVKSDAYERLFQPYGNAVAARVREHHEAHGGVSRYDKIPLYLQWAGEAADAQRTHQFCERFSELVYAAVIDSAWVPGVREYLHAHHASQTFVLITATPHDEMLRILAATQIEQCFREVHGAPMAKAAAIESVLKRWRCAPAQSLVVGDSESDLAAAAANGVLFLLRCTSLNRNLQRSYTGPRFSELS